MFHELRQTSSPDCISDLRFDAWLAQELAPPELEALCEHVAHCARCQARQAALVEQRRRFEAEHAPPAWLEPRSSKPPGIGKGRMRWAITTRLGAALAAALVIIVLETQMQPHGGTPNAERSKGGDSVGFFVKRGELVQRGAPEQHLLPGDKLRFTYTASAARYLAILSLDGRGHASVYYPGGANAVRVDAGVEVPLPSAVELDETLGREQILALFCASALELAPLLSALEARPLELPIPSGCTIDRLSILKEAVSK